MSQPFITENENQFIGRFLHNINTHYPFPDVECELRAGLSLPQFEGDINLMNLTQFRKVIDFYDNLVTKEMDSDIKVKRVTANNTVNTSLDITFQKKHNLNLGIQKLRFSLNEVSAISDYCMTNKLPSLSEWRKNKKGIDHFNRTMQLIYKGSLDWKITTEEEQQEFDSMIAKGYTTKNNRANIDLESIRTRIGGKVELKYDFVKRDFVPSDISNPYLSSLKKEANEAYSSLQSADYSLLFKNFRLKNRVTYEIILKGSTFQVDITRIKTSKTDYNTNMIPVKNFIDSEIGEQDEMYEYEIEFHTNNNLSQEILTEFIREIYIPSLSSMSIYPIYTTLTDQKTVIQLYRQEVSKMLQNRIQSKLNTFPDIYEYQSLRSKSSEETDDLKAKIAALNSKYNDFHFYNLVKDQSNQSLRQLEAEYIKKQRSIIRQSDEYRSDNNYFISPKVVSIELNNVRETSPESIWSNYTVTDKADGYSMILIKFRSDIMPSNGDPSYQNKMYLIDSNMRVYDTGITSEFSKGSYIFNGEYLQYDADKNPLHKYGVFDCYLFDGVDVCNLPLMDVSAEIETRLSKMNTYFPKKIIPPENQSEFSIFVKKFSIATPEKNIFQHSNDIWVDYQAKIPHPLINSRYYLDGLIYTHAKYPVGYNPTNQDYDLKQNNTWKSNLKWKPPEDNTIDFLIRFDTIDVATKGKRKVTKNKIKKIPTVIEGVTSYNEYVSARLYNGGNHITRSNPCFNSNIKYSKVLQPILFEPPQPVIENIYNILIPIKQSLFYKKADINSEDGEPIDDNTIVEVSYTNFDQSLPGYQPNPNLRWSILRTRHDKTFQYKQGLRRQEKAFQKVNKCLEMTLKPEGSLREWEITLLERSVYLIDSIPSVRHFMRKSHSEINGYELFSKFKDKISEYYQSPLDFKTNINFGNHMNVAHNIWRTIYNPVTPKMICTGQNIPTQSQEEEKYYNTDRSSRSREKSVTITMQNFHNKVIKNRILLGTVTKLLKEQGITNISLLDLACGKGGDIPKWRDHNIKTCVGIDYMHNNIEDFKDGACARNNFYKEQSHKYNNPYPDIYFLVGDVSKSILEERSIIDKRYTTLFNNLWNPNTTLDTMFSKNKFNIVSVMFATHYFFKSPIILDNFVKNISDNLKKGGYFIGCCFDGHKIFELLKSIPRNGSKQVYKNGSLMWKIIKDYREIQFPANESSVGLPIKVFMNSINQIIEEFLVNFEILKSKLAAYNIIPLSSEEMKKADLPDVTGQTSIGSFKDVYQFIKNSSPGSDYHKLSKDIRLTSEESELSFLFNYFIFKKKTEGDNIIDDIVRIILTSPKYIRFLKNAKHHPKIQSELTSTYPIDSINQGIRIAYSTYITDQKKVTSPKPVVSSSAAGSGAAAASIIGTISAPDSKQTQPVSDEKSSSKQRKEGAAESVSPISSQVTPPEPPVDTAKGVRLPQSSVRSIRSRHKQRKRLPPQAAKLIKYDKMIDRLKSKQGDGEDQYSHLYAQMIEQLDQLKKQSDEGEDKFWSSELQSLYDKYKPKK